MRTIAMNMSDDRHDPKIGLPDPLFASSWMALLLLLRNELSNRITGASEQGDAADSDNNASLN